MANNHITEKISFLTQIHTAWDGTEQRQALRQFPRMYCSYDYSAMNLEQSQLLRMALYHNQSTMIRFPLWQCAFGLGEKLYNRTTAITIPNEMIWCFRNISMVMIWCNDEIGGLVYTIEYLTSFGEMGIDAPLDRDYEANSFSIIPVFYGVFEINGTYTTHHNEIMETTYNLERIRDQNLKYMFPEETHGIDHDEDFADSSVFRFGLPEYYNDMEVWRYEPDWVEPADGNYEKNTNRLDNDTGVFRFDVKSYDPIENVEYVYTCMTRATINNIQRFFFRHKGAWKSFYAPTWTSDIELAEDADAGTMVLYTKNIWYWKYYQKSTIRKKAIVFFRDNTYAFLDIAGYTINDDGDKGLIYLETECDRDLIKSEILMISFWVRYRFESDDMDIDYETNSVARIALTLKEVQNE